MARVDEWVEVAGSSVDIAVQAALDELGLQSRDEVDVEVIREPSKGILGTGWRAQDALVKVTPKAPTPTKKRRRRSRKRNSESNRSEGKAAATDSGKSSAGKPAADRSGSKKKSGSRASDRSGSSKSGGRQSGQQRNEQKGSSSQRSGQRTASSRGGSESNRSASASSGAESSGRPQEATIEEQATVAAEFITGLLDAFGLEGTVETSIDDDILLINVAGDQTEALVGRKGAIMQAVHEITRTVVQRKTFGAPRMRLDINGYGERRREALRIYSARQAERVLADGGEIMLEPMNPADRKVVHDAIGEIEGVESYSEGEEPTRAVVISPTTAPSE